MKMFLIAALAFVSIGASAGPFGLSKGMSVEQVKKHTPYLDWGPYKFKSGTLAGGHKYFSNYLMTVTPQEGLCSVTGTGTEIVDPYGKQLQEQFRELSSILSAKYGAPTAVTDQVNPNLAWSEPRNWTFSLSKGERMLKAAWNQSLPESLASITLEVRNLGHSYTADRGYLQLQYEFDNIRDCKAWLNAKEASQL